MRLLLYCILIGLIMYVCYIYMYIIIDSEIGALIVLFIAAKFFEGVIQFPDIRTMIVSSIPSPIEPESIFIINSSCLAY